MQAIALRLWVPSMYGWFFLFLDGEPVGCFTPEAFRQVREGATPPDLQRLPPSDRRRLEQFFEQGPQPITVIDPEHSTILDRNAAKAFIPTFYSYFSRIFHEGSPFIDSDTDFLPIISRYFPAAPAQRGIDLGAGSGFYAKALARCIEEVIAVDVVTDRLQRLDVQNITVVAADLEELPFKDEFDFAMCNFVLEHVGDPYKVCAQISKCLRAGGRFVLSFPSFNPRDIYAAKFLGEMPTLNFEHIRSFSAETGVHPWESLTGDLIACLGEHACHLSEIRGTFILRNVGEPLRSEIRPFIDIEAYESTARPPWNLYGQQTILHGYKHDGTERHPAE